MKKCIVYGAGKHATRLINLLKRDDYSIVAVCDSDPQKKNTNYHGYIVIDKEQAIELCQNDKEIELIIGVVNPEAYQDIVCISKREFPDYTHIVLSEKEIRNRVELNEMERYYNNIEYKWNVDICNQFGVWLDNLDSEIEYWIYNGLIRGSVGSEYFRDTRRMKRREVPFREPDLDKLVKDGDIVMDIGCALISGFGEKLSQGHINLVPVDALAHYYNIMNSMDSEAIEDTYYCNFGTFELLSNLFPRNYADYIYISNALDHSFDPLMGVIKSLYILKVGGVIKMKHRKAEAVHEAWQGLHKWNVDCIKGDFVIWNKENAVNVSEKLKDYADVEVRDTNELDRNDQFITVLIKKKTEIELSWFIDIEEEGRTMGKIIRMLFEKMSVNGGLFKKNLSEFDI